MTQVPPIQAVKTAGWRRDLRARLAELHLSPAREAEIVEELSQHLDDRYEELRRAGASDHDARRVASEELNEGGGLAQRMQALAQAHTPAPVVHGRGFGADARSVWWAVTGTTLRQLGLGLLLGTAGAAAIATVLPAMLVSTVDSSYLTFVGVVVLLIAAGVTASTVPARRAMRLDPTIALQTE